MMEFLYRLRLLMSAFQISNDGIVKTYSRFASIDQKLLSVARE